MAKWKDKASLISEKVQELEARLASDLTYTFTRTLTLALALALALTLIMTLTFTNLNTTLIRALTDHED